MGKEPEKVCSPWKIALDSQFFYIASCICSAGNISASSGQWKVIIDCYGK